MIKKLMSDEIVVYISHNFFYWYLRLVSFNFHHHLQNLTIPSLSYNPVRVYILSEKLLLLNTLSKALRLHLTENVLDDDFDTVRFLVRKLLLNNW